MARAVSAAQQGPLSRPPPVRGPTGTVPRARRTASAGGARTSSSSSAGGGRAASSRGGPSSAGILRFYTDEAPGLRIGPTFVLVSSLAFIGSVVLLHIWAKFSSR